MDRSWRAEGAVREDRAAPADGTHGKRRVDDRRMISGVAHVVKSGGRWADVPTEVYGPKKTLYNRFVRWAAKGVWTGLQRGNQDETGATIKMRGYGVPGKLRLVIAAGRRRMDLSVEEIIRLPGRHVTGHQMRPPYKVRAARVNVNYSVMDCQFFEK